MIERLQYAVAWTFVKMLGVLPRPVARGIAAAATRLLLLFLPKLRKTAEFNLKLAFPDWTDAQRRAVMKGMARNLGWMAAEFARLPQYTKENIAERGGSGWAREFSGRAEPRERRAVPYGAYWGVGTFVVCARVVWVSAALHGAAAGQRAAGRAGESLSGTVWEQADLQE